MIQSLKVKNRNNLFLQKESSINIEDPNFKVFVSLYPQILENKGLNHKNGIPFGKITLKLNNPTSTNPKEQSVFEGTISKKGEPINGIYTSPLTQNFTYKGNFFKGSTDGKGSYTNFENGNQATSFWMAGSLNSTTQIQFKNGDVLSCIFFYRKIYGDVEISQKNATTPKFKGKIEFANKIDASQSYGTLDKFLPDHVDRIVVHPNEDKRIKVYYKDGSSFNGSLCTNFMRHRGLFLDKDGIGSEMNFGIEEFPYIQDRKVFRDPKTGFIYKLNQDLGNNIQVRYPNLDKFIGKISKFKEKNGFYIQNLDEGEVIASKNGLRMTYTGRLYMKILGQLVLIQGEWRNGKTVRPAAIYEYSYPTKNGGDNQVGGSTITNRLLIEGNLVQDDLLSGLCKFHNADGTVSVANITLEHEIKWQKGKGIGKPIKNLSSWLKHGQNIWSFQSYNKFQIGDLQYLPGQISSQGSNSQIICYKDGTCFRNMKAVSKYFEMNFLDSLGQYGLFSSEKYSPSFIEGIMLCNLRKFRGWIHPKNTRQGRNKKVVLLGYHSRTKDSTSDKVHSRQSEEGEIIYRGMSMRGDSKGQLMFERRIDNEIRVSNYDCRIEDLENQRMREDYVKRDPSHRNILLKKDNTIEFFYN